MLSLAPANANAQKPTLAPLSGDDFHRALAALRPEIFGRALRMARSTEVAEDLAQDTIERAIRFSDSFQLGTNLRAWVFQILFSVFITRCRRARRERVALGVLSSDPCAWTNPDERASMEQLSPPVARALRDVPKPFREAIVLVDLEEMSYKAAARQLRVPIGTVMSRLHRGRKLLAQKVSVPDRMRAAA
jgi:RNA polymerase sigma-70 factor (ECF subfamily)